MFAAIRKLCTPAHVYLVVSVIAMIILIIQNASNTNSYCVGAFECEVPDVASLFIAKGIYIIFWTFVLNSICKGGGPSGKKIAWFLVIVPWLLMAIAIALLFAHSEPHGKEKHYPPSDVMNI